MYCRYTVSRQCSNKTNYTVRCGYDCGGSDSPEADTDMNRRTKIVEGSLNIYNCSKIYLIEQYRNWRRV